jgi:hypothetical protein
MKQMHGSAKRQCEYATEPCSVKFTGLAQKFQVGPRF